MSHEMHIGLPILCLEVVVIIFPFLLQTVTWLFWCRDCSNLLDSVFVACTNLLSKTLFKTNIFRYIAERPNINQLFDRSITVEFLLCCANLYG